MTLPCYSTDDQLPFLPDLATPGHGGGHIKSHHLGGWDRRMTSFGTHTCTKE